MAVVGSPSLRGKAFIPDICNRTDLPQETLALYGCPVIRTPVEEEEPPIPIPRKQLTVRTVRRPFSIPPEPSLKKKTNLTNLALVLDLDETLVHTFDPQYKLADGTYDRLNPEYRKLPNYYSIKCDDGSLVEGLVRPYAKEFLETAFNLTYPLFVFTAGSASYAEEICNILFPVRKPTKIYNRDHCHDGSKLKKPVLLIHKEFPDMITDGRILIVDDRQDVYYAIDQRTLFKIPPWRGKDMNDNHLLEVRRLLVELCSHSRGIIQSPIFDQKFVTGLYNHTKL